MTSYAVILGRGIGCGVATDAASPGEGSWMDATFTTEERKVYLPVFLLGMKRQAEQQRAGRGPDSCAQVREQFPRVNWP
jgi:hypothetical protein